MPNIVGKHFVSSIAVTDSMNIMHELIFITLEYLGSKQIFFEQKPTLACLRLDSHVCTASIKIK